MVLTLLERWGIYHIQRYLKKRRFLLGVVACRYVTGVAVFLSFVIGFVITAVIAVADILFFSELALVFSSFKMAATFILLNAGLIGVEFWLLFHVGFQVVARYIMAMENHLAIDSDMEASLVRAVLELDEPNTHQFGLNPALNRQRHYWLALILYRSKVILSNFVAKLIARRLLSRFGMRAYAPLIATVITGWWDGWVQSAVLREARLRLTGRLYILKTLEFLDTQRITNTDAYHLELELLSRLVAIRFELFGRYNANLDYFMDMLDSRLEGSILDLDNIQDVKRLVPLWHQLAADDRQRMSEIACMVLALKSGSLSAGELALADIFSLTSTNIRSTRRHLCRQIIEGGANTTALTEV